jgi:hypothetical protein
MLLSAPCSAAEGAHHAQTRLAAPQLLLLQLQKQQRVRSCCLQASLGVLHLARLLRLAWLWERLQQQQQQQQQQYRGFLLRHTSRASMKPLNLTR